MTANCLGGNILQAISSRPMTPAVAADYLGLDIKTITRWARQGSIPAYALGDGKRKFWRFLQSELDLWLLEKTNRKVAA